MIAAVTTPENLERGRALRLEALGAHVGDNSLDDVEGARSFGMRAAHYAAGGRPPAAAADVVVADLAELPSHLDAVFRK